MLYSFVHLAGNQANSSLKIARLYVNHRIPYVVLNCLKLGKSQLMGLATRALKSDPLDPGPRSGFNVVSCELQTACYVDFVHCTVTQYSMQLKSRSRPCGAKWSFHTNP